ncbi:MULTISPECIES: amidohydrolase family protein [unclassified Adlercreutzia]|uniref:amidohydrolase family protein n=1 Tax=unclassified Adlercreutzia TaxID=2636013 RepID=UPI0013EAFBB8|nr:MULTISPECIES: amidohydrolase family protein [unclassified Adlercreutzia]
MLICAQYVFPITSDPITGGAVLVRDGKILDVGKVEMLRLRYPEEEVVDYGLAAVMPGLVDLHTRLEKSVLRGMVADMPYASWILSVIERSGRLEAGDWYDSAILGGLDALSSGITTIADITSTGAACTATQKLGLRGVMYREVGVMDKQRVSFAMRSAEKDIMHWREEVDPDRVTVGIAPAAVYATHPSVFGLVSEFACKEGLPVAMRLAGSHEEFNFVKYGSSMFSVHTMDEAKRGYVEIPPWMPTGVTPVRYALNWGAFESPNVLLVHAVHVDEEDIKKMREYDVAVCTCPRANAQLGMGVAPLGAFLRAGLRTGLGTDSPAATESTDMLSEMRVSMLIQRALDTRRFLDSTTMLELATMGGARALGLEDKIGSLDIGKCADLIAVDLSSSHQSAGANPVSAVVNTCSASDVLMTMVDGRMLYEKNHWHVDVEVAKNIARVIEIRTKLRV